MADAIFGLFSLCLFSIGHLSQLGTGAMKKIRKTSVPLHGAYILEGEKRRGGEQQNHVASHAWLVLERPT